MLVELSNEVEDTFPLAIFSYSYSKIFQHCLLARLLKVSLENNKKANVTNIYDIEQTLSLSIYISFIIQRFDDGKVNGKT